MSQKGLNLWKTIIRVLNNHGRKWKDVKKVGVRQGYFNKETFEKISKETFYYSTDSSVKIAEDLRIQGKDFIIKWEGCHSNDDFYWQGWHFIEIDFIGEKELINIDISKNYQ